VFDYHAYIVAHEVPYIPEPTHDPEPDEPAPEWVSLGEYTLTAYCLCVKCCGIWSAEHPSRAGTDYVHRTASGTVAEVGRTVGVNPNVIPYGTVIWIDGHGEFTAEDSGAIPRRSRVIDIYLGCHQTALDFGRQSAEVWAKKE